MNTTQLGSIPVGAELAPSEDAGPNGSKVPNPPQDFTASVS